MSKLKIKRNTTNSDAPENTQLVRGELAYNETTESLYIGSGDNGSGLAGSVVNLGGKGLFVDKATNQTGIAGNKTFSGNITVTGDLTVNGTTTTVNSTTTTVDDPVFTVGGDSAPGSDDSKDRGIEFRYYDGSAKIGFFGWDNDADAFTFLTSATNSSEQFSGTAAKLVTGEVEATSLDISGNADIDGTLETDGLSINGTTVTSTGAELNILDGVTASATDINLIDGITNGTVSASKAIITDANKDITGGRNITISGELDAATLDISGNADIDGTLEADDITIDGTTLAEYIADTVGAMVGSNTETGITVTYQDSDNTLDFAIGTLDQDTTGTADHVTITDNESTNENNLIPFVEDAGGAGSRGLESDGDFHYNPSTGTVTATAFEGTIDGGTWS